MYYVSRFLGFLTPLPPPLSSIVSIWHDPPLVLRKIFETPPPLEQKKSHVVYQSTHIGKGVKVAQLKFYDKLSSIKQ